MRRSIRSVVKPVVFEEKQQSRIPQFGHVRGWFNEEISAPLPMHTKNQQIQKEQRVSIRYQRIELSRTHYEAGIEGYSVTLLKSIVARGATVCV